MLFWNIVYSIAIVDSSRFRKQSLTRWTKLYYNVAVSKVTYKEVSLSGQCWLASVQVDQSKKWNTSHIQFAAKKLSFYAWSIFNMECRSNQK